MISICIISGQGKNKELKENDEDNESKEPYKNIKTRREQNTQVKIVTEENNKLRDRERTKSTKKGLPRENENPEASKRYGKKKEPQDKEQAEERTKNLRIRNKPRKEQRTSG